MKKSSHSRVKRLFTSLFNVKSWIDYERIRAGKQYIVERCTTYFVPGKIQKTESFESAKAKLKLSDKDLLVRQKGLLRLSLTMAGVAILMFIYALYNLFYAYYLAVLISLVVVLMALAMAFRYHFWYFQIKQKKLGCSFREWFSQGILGDKDE
jgi:intracellular multiplication protein IcmV